jgi:hypothetical protein
LPYYYNQYNKTITAFLTDSVNNVKFEVTDLTGAKSTIEKSYNGTSVILAASGNITRVQLAALINDVTNYELPAITNPYADLDFIPYEMRTVVSALNNNGLMTEYSQYNMFAPKEPATQQMVADAVNKIAGRSLYVPTNPAAGITMSEAVQLMYSAIGSR